ncbi:MAG: ABC transporter permease [Nitrospinota bacterium]|nr:MAG: ABC transporter permease [Nitrospinota bacterium]
MWERVYEIIRKEVYQTLREPRMRMVLISPPLIQLIIFGFAVNLDVEQARIAWMDLDRTPQSRALLSAFQGSRHFLVTHVLEREAEVRELLDRGTVQAVVRVQPGFARRLLHNQTATVQILIDGTNSNTASLISVYTTQVIARFSDQALWERERRRRVAVSVETGTPVNVPAPGISVRSRIWFNPDLRSQHYFVPGIIVQVITLVTLMLTAMSIVREKELGTMEQLLVTPIRPYELILGKTLPFAVVGLLEMVLVTVAALLVFHVPLRGHFLLLMGCSALFLMTSLGTGLFISTVSQTQQQAMMSSFFFIMPAFMLSGFTFPIRNMPLPIQYLTYLNPVRYFMEIVRGIFLKGSDITILWPQMLALFLLGLAILGASVLRFRKRLE